MQMCDIVVWRRKKKAILLPPPSQLSPPPSKRTKPKNNLMKSLQAFMDAASWGSWRTWSTISPTRNGVTPNFPQQGTPANPHVPPGPKVGSFVPTNYIYENLSLPHATEIVHTF